MKRMISIVICLVIIFSSYSITVVNAETIEDANKYVDSHSYKFSTYAYSVCVDFPSIIPTIIDSDNNDALYVNKEILKLANSIFDFNNNSIHKGNPELFEMKYENYLNNGILSIVLEIHLVPSTNYRRYYVYNFDVSNSKLLSTQDIIDRYGINKNDLKTFVKSKIESSQYYLNDSSSEYKNSSVNAAMSCIDNAGYSIELQSQDVDWESRFIANSGDLGSVPTALNVMLYVNNLSKVCCKYLCYSTAGTKAGYLEDAILDENIYDKTMNIFSDHLNLSVKVGDTIRIGAGIANGNVINGDVSKITCSVYNSSILSVNSTCVKDNCRFYEFNTHSIGTTYVTFSDSNTGLTKRFPVSVCENKTISYTISNIPTIKGDNYVTNFCNFNGMYVDNYMYSTSSDGKTTVNFDVYNLNYIYGAVEVYNGEGMLCDAIVIEKMTNNKSNIKETVWDQSCYLVSDIIEGDIFTYREQISSKKTSIKVKIPKNGYIKITNDTNNSFIVSLLNGVDIFMGLKSVCGDIKGFDSKSDDFAKEITKQIVENAAYAQFCKEQDKYVKKLWSGVAKSTVFSTESMGNFLDSFTKNLFELKLEKLVFDTASSFGWSTTESLFEYFSGPVGTLLKGLFVFADVCNIVVQCKHMSDRSSCGDICIQNQTGNTRSISQISVEAKTNFDSNTALRAYEVSIDSDELEMVKILNPKLFDEITSTESTVYNISMIKDGKEFQIDSEVEVVVPIPDNMKHLESYNAIAIYRLEQDGTKTKMMAEVIDGKIRFRTEHFSIYVISTSLCGDVDLDKYVSITDATYIQKYLAKMIDFNDIQINVADTNGDGYIDIADATIIQKYLAGLVSELGQPTTISLNASTLSMNVGETKTLSAKITPSSIQSKGVTWTSSNASIVSVFNGVLTAKTTGKATITAKTYDGKTAKCDITVSPVEVSNISLNANSVTLNQGETYQLSATVSPSNATNKSITWSTSDSSVVSVSSTGKLTANSNGVVKITAKSNNGKTAECTITVKDKWEGYTKIYSANDFNNIRNDLSGKYVLMNDIDLSIFGNWTPIGSRYSAFKGSLDGQNHTIKLSGLSDDGYGNFGLFAVTGSSVEFKNLILTGTVEINSDKVVCCGLLAAVCSGTKISNCTNNTNLKINAEYREDNFSLSISVIAGGLIGSISTFKDSEQISNCTNDGTILVKSKGGMHCTIAVGGLVGNTSQGVSLMFVDCKNKGRIESKALTYYYGVSSGGIVGSSFLDSIKFKDCENKGSVFSIIEGSNWVSQCSAGGILGLSWNDNFQTENCISTDVVAECEKGDAFIGKEIGYIGEFTKVYKY